MTSTEIPQIFLDIAKQDLKSSQLLFENECYPQSVFYFQQAVEKTMKSIAVWLEFTTLKDANKEIGHQGMNFYGISHDKQKENIDNMKEKKEQAEFISQALNMGSADETIESVENELEEANKLIKSHSKPKKFVRLSNKEVKQFLNEIYKIKNEYRVEQSARSDFFESDEQWQNFLDETASLMIQVIEYYPDDFEKQGIVIPDNIRELVEDEFERALKVSDVDAWNMLASTNLDSNFIIKILFYLCILADSHAIKARYPSKNFNPIEFYTAELSLIKQLLEILDITNEVISLLDSIYLRVNEGEAKRLAREAAIQ